MKWPKTYFQLLIGLGVSQLGNWIYLIALNVYVWHLTSSPAAVAGLYIIGPAIRIICSFFVGSYIDRWDKKKIVVLADILRGFIVCFMPFADQLWLVYFLVASTNVAGSFFGPSSTYLISTLVNDSHKQRFNSIHATLNSGSFMIGPALAGAILAITNTSAAMWINAATFFLCALLLSYLPNSVQKNDSATKLLSLSVIKEDWQITTHYAKTIASFSRFLVVYSIALMIAFALDSQEMTFLLDHLNISESLYGVTVTVAGIGAIVGGFAATYFANKFSVSTYIKAGFLCTLLSYLSFYASNSYTVAVISFICLGFFMAFSNSGFATLYQTTVKLDIMGRFGSMLSLVQNLLQVILTLIIGLLAEWFSLQLTTVIFAVVAVLLGVWICLFKLQNDY